MTKRKEPLIIQNKKDVPNHLHLAWFGSELACKLCNPYCYEKHQMGMPNNLEWCGHDKCPMKPETKVVKKK
jgi:hypothetical protein